VSILYYPAISSNQCTVQPSVDHANQATDIYQQSPILSILFLQNALHNDHLSRTQLPNNRPKSAPVARGALTNK
jgi:hypothetical protein